jgi:hypothetical protein
MGMKHRSFAIFLSVLIGAAPVNARTAMALEKARYEVVEREGSYEIRQYEDHIVAETFVDGGFDEAGNEGFNLLFRYIQGNNRKSESISMTAPVSQRLGPEKIAMTAPVGQQRDRNAWRITFLMPSSYTMETLPEPLDGRVHLRREAGRLVASVRYSGNWSEERFEKKRAELLAFIERRGLRPDGETVFARYNPPFMPPFLRRNEVHIPVAGETD